MKKDYRGNAARLSTGIVGDVQNSSYYMGGCSESSYHSSRYAYSFNEGKGCTRSRSNGEYSYYMVCKKASGH